MIAEGAYGTFEGAAADQVVFGAYQREGTWSPELVALLGRLVQTRGSFVDVGAHIGLVAIPVAERSGCACLAVEPEPGNFALLQRNIARHGLNARVHAIHGAAHYTAGRVCLALSRDNSGDHHVLASAPTDRATVEVPAARLDDWVAAHELPEPFVVKLDTQGAEVAVLRGAPHTLQRASHLVVEYWPAGLRRQGESAEALASLLQTMPFGAVLGPRFDGRLVTRAQVFESLAWIPDDGSDEGFFDVLLSREPTLPR